MADISIIIPCYNAEQYIDRCLTSIVSQTIGINALEIICVDDASTDSTWAHLQTWEQKYPDNIILIHCDTNGRQGTARNIGLQYASSPYISFIDADDWIEYDYYEIMYAYAHELNCDVVCCSYERDMSQTPSPLINRKTGFADRYLIIDTTEKRKIFLVNQSMSYVPVTKLIRKALLLNNNIHFAENTTYEDQLWGSLIHLYAESAMIIEQKLYHYFVNPMSTVLQKNAMHHIDWLTVMLIKWHEWESRKVFGLYHTELEYEFLITCYCGIFRTLILRYDNPSYSLYLLLRQITLEHIPNYQANPYIEGRLSEFQLLLLPSLSNLLNQREFKLLVKNAKIYLTIHG